MGYKTSVMKFDGAGWVDVGLAGFSPGQASYPSLAFDNGTPYVAFQDYTNSYKASVMKFDAPSGNWVSVGSPGFSSARATYLSLAFNSGIPYVAFTDEMALGKASLFQSTDQIFAFDRTKCRHAQ
jgi:hypothetical protein